MHRLIRQIRNECGFPRRSAAAGAILPWTIRKMQVFPRWSTPTRNRQAHRNAEHRCKRMDLKQFRRSEANSHHKSAKRKDGRENRRAPSTPPCRPTRSNTHFSAFVESKTLNRAERRRTTRPARPLRAKEGPESDAAKGPGGTCRRARIGTRRKVRIGRAASSGSRACRLRKTTFPFLVE